MNHQKIENNNIQLSAKLAGESTLSRRLCLLPPNLLEQVSSSTTENKLQAGTLQILKLLAAMGMNRELLALLLEMAEFRADHLRYLMGPLVFHQTSWVGMNPDKNGQPSTKSSLKMMILEHFEAVINNSLNNTTDQTPQNAKVVRFCLGEM